MIELENVTMTYPGGMTALKNVNINRKRRVCLYRWKQWIW